MKKVLILFVNLFLLWNSYCCFAQEMGKTSANGLNIINDLDSTYHPDVVSISKDGLIKGRDNMKSYLLDFYTSQGSLVDFKTHYKIPVYQLLEYEIGSSQTVNGGRFSHIRIWTKEHGSRQIIAEVIYGNSATLVEVPVELTKAREKWVELCNKKNAKKLVSELYTEDAIYYNRGRVLRGHDQLSREYLYMENPSYTLQLNPTFIEMVADDVIYEIGMCSGSYNLPYILVWKKQADDNWQIYLDSNY